MAVSKERVPGPVTPVNEALIEKVRIAIWENHTRSLIAAFETTVPVYPDEENIFFLNGESYYMIKKRVSYLLPPHHPTGLTIIDYFVR